MHSILFVCLGNICRSPAAEGMLKHLAQSKNFQEVHVQSCGLGNWHAGHLPDERMREAAKKRGIILTSRAQQFHRNNFEQFDYILVADQDVMNTIYQYAESAEHKAKIHLITAFSSRYQGEEIPDPFYEGEAIFNLVLDMLEDSCEGLLEHLQKQ